MSGSRPSPAPVNPALSGGTDHPGGHFAGDADWLEDSVFGTLDGVITSLALVVSVAGVLRLDHRQTFLTITAAAVAGALSMFVGALLSARTRAELVRRERAQEARCIVETPDREREEIRRIFRSRGFIETDVETLTRSVTSDPERWLDMLMRDELGLEPVTDRYPHRHAAGIGASYLMGALVPALPFLFPLWPAHQEAYASVVLGGLELVTVGLLQARYAGTSWLRGAGEILLFGLGTAFLVYLLALAIGPIPGI